MVNSSVKPPPRGPVQICKGCVHFFVTYDPVFPYGCREMGFKSRRYPHLEVQAATGEPCQGHVSRRVSEAASGRG